MQKLAVMTVAAHILSTPALAQAPCDIANGAVRLQMISQACQRPLSKKGQMTLAIAQEKPAVMACKENAFNQVKAELQDIMKLGGKPGVEAWCNTQRQSLPGLLR